MQVQLVPAECCCTHVPKRHTQTTRMPQAKAGTARAHLVRLREGLELLGIPSLVWVLLLRQPSVRLGDRARVYCLAHPQNLPRGVRRGGQRERVQSVARKMMDTRRIAVRASDGLSRRRLALPCLAGGEGALM